MSAALPAGIRLRPAVPHLGQLDANDTRPAFRYAVYRGEALLGYVFNRSAPSASTHAGWTNGTRGAALKRWWTYELATLGESPDRSNVTRFFAVEDLIKWVDEHPTPAQAKPRTFAIPPAPEDLAAVTDLEGERWEPHGSWTHWVQTSSGVIAGWEELVFHYGPLTEIVEGS